MKKFLQNIKTQFSFFTKLKKIKKRQKNTQSIQTEIFNPQEQNINSLETNKKTRIKTKCLQYKSDKDNYKCKRKQLKINYGFLHKNNYFSQNKNYILIGFVPILLGLFLFIIYGPIYTLKFINIIALDSITNVTLSYSAMDDFYDKKMINIDKDLMKNKFIQYQNNIKDVEIKYSLPKTLEIKISSFPVFFNTQINKKFFLITQNGVLVPGKPREGLKTMIIKNKIDKNILPDYKKFYKQEYMENIYEAYQYLEENVIDIQVKELQFYPTEREIHFLLENNTLLIYTLSKNLKAQIKKTVIYNTERKKLSDTDVVYIDFRVKRTLNNTQKDKIYYCTRDIETQCKNNLKKIYSLYSK